VAPAVITVGCVGIITGGPGAYCGGGAETTGVTGAATGWFAGAALASFWAAAAAGGELADWDFLPQAVRNKTRQSTGSKRKIMAGNQWNQL